MAEKLHIFSYLPNPRVWKACIAADLCQVEIVVVGDKPSNLPNWLWDFNARALTKKEMHSGNPLARQGRRGFSTTLYKTDTFLEAHPFGTVPAAFSPDGIGVFESNSILRATVRVSDLQHDLYGTNAYEASRIDSFLDAGLVFSREAQVYLLAIDQMIEETYNRMAASYEFYASGIETALSSADYIATNSLSIADISFVCDMAQFMRELKMVDRLSDQNFEPISRNARAEFPRLYQHLTTLCNRDDFRRHIGSYADHAIKSS